MASRLHRIVFGSVFMSGSAAAFITAYMSSSDDSAKKVDAKTTDRPKRLPPLPTRAEQIQSLQEKEFDVLVIGGGATGSGVALDAISRGLKTAMVELDDFSSGTSSRSTKLIHGGVRYLQKAIMALDFEQYRMVKEALYERANLLAIAPHLSYPLPIMLPVYKWWQVPYYWVGIKMYDLVAGSKCLKQSYFLSKSKALELFPMLKKDKLCGAIVYYDGQHNDARMNLAIALTAARMGASIANHVAVVRLYKKGEKDGKKVLCGARCKDLISGCEFDVRAKCVINATGPFTDSIRLMDNPKAPPICQPSSGVHIILPDYYSPQMMGLLDPSTSDGRVIFFLPWQGVTIAGTTDNPCEVTHSPAPTEADIQFILKEIRGYLSPDIEVRRGDVLSAWAGIRPLVLDPNKENTESIARNHIIHISSSNLVTIAGGKWTTYRAMAKEAMDAAVQCTNLSPQSESKTDGLLLEGAHAYSPIMYIRLVQDFGLDSEVALHLANTYGDRAFSVAKLARLTGVRWPIVGRRLHQEFPYIEAEVRYAVKEYACTTVDVIARRLRLSFLNCQAAEEALPRIVEIMAEELSWSKAEQKNQKERAIQFLRGEMGMDINKASREDTPINLTRDEIKDYIKRFQTLDVDKKGYISVNDLRRSFKKHGEMVSEQELHEILREVDTSRNGQVELGEYLQLCANMKKLGQVECASCQPDHSIPVLVVPIPDNPCQDHIDVHSYPCHSDSYASTCNSHSHASACHSDLHAHVCPSTQPSDVTKDMHSKVCNHTNDKTMTNSGSSGNHTHAVVQESAEDNEAVKSTTNLNSRTQNVKELEDKECVVKHDSDSSSDQNVKKAEDVKANIKHLKSSGDDERSKVWSNFS